MLKRGDEKQKKEEKGKENERLERCRGVVVVESFGGGQRKRGARPARGVWLVVVSGGQEKKKRAAAPTRQAGKQASSTSTNKRSTHQAPKQDNRRTTKVACSTRLGGQSLGLSQPNV